MQMSVLTLTCGGLRVRGEFCEVFKKEKRGTKHRLLSFFSLSPLCSEAAV